jgi:hypothetical protein
MTLTLHLWLVNFQPKLTKPQGYLWEWQYLEQLVSSKLIKVEHANSRHRIMSLDQHCGQQRGVIVIANLAYINTIQGAPLFSVAQEGHFTSEISLKGRPTTWPSTKSGSQGQLDSSTTAWQALIFTPFMHIPDSYTNVVGGTTYSMHSRVKPRAVLSDTKRGCRPRAWSRGQGFN